MSRVHVRCRNTACRAARVLKRHPETYERLPPCRSCGCREYLANGWMNRRDTKKMSCDCAGYVHLTNRVFPHRKGSLYCWYRANGSQRMEGDVDFKDARLE